jgi:VWFA-related protein
MVQVDAFVRDSSGRTLEGLRLDDFRVYEDNELQELANLSQDELPLAVAIVVDRSGSVSPYLAELRRIATRALYNLKMQDEVCLFSFAEYAKLHEDLTNDRHRIVDALNRIRTGGMTNIRDALFEAVHYLAREAPDTRHTVVLISDNKQTAQPFVSELELIAEAQETDTVIYSIKTSRSRPAFANQLPAMVAGDPLDRITEETGGEVIKADNVTNLDRALRTIISRLKTRYTLAYYPSRSSQGERFHTIAVRLTHRFGTAGRDYFILAKQGYYSTEAANLPARE